MLKDDTARQNVTKQSEACVAWHSAISLPWLREAELSRRLLRSLSFSITPQQIFSGMTVNLLTLNCSKTEFLLIGRKQQLAKFHNSSVETTHTARSLSFIFYEHLFFSDQNQISAQSKSWYSHIRKLRCICPYFNFKTAKLDYCNWLYYSLYHAHSYVSRQHLSTIK